MMPLPGLSHLLPLLNQRAINLRVMRLSSRAGVLAKTIVINQPVD
jgi:hypothetical protein